MGVMLRGEASDAQIAAFVLALHMKGETAEELAGFARAMRDSALRIPYQTVPGEALLDTCGTGGDGQNTFNISTTVAFVVAGCGVRVAKHGNRAMSSRSGSADVLRKLGVTISGSPEHAARALREVGICFLFAPAFHPAMLHVLRVRLELKMRTVFNLLGPLANPAPTSSQIVGAPSLQAAERMANALASLGLKRGYVVHGEDGLDEFTLTAATHVFEICEGAVTYSRTTPEDLGMLRCTLRDLEGGGPAENAQTTIDILEGARGPRRQIVTANAALALTASGAAQSSVEGVALAEESIDSGAARRKLRELADLRDDQIAPL